MLSSHTPVMMRDSRELRSCLQLAPTAFLAFRDAFESVRSGVTFPPSFSFPSGFYFVDTAVGVASNCFPCLRCPFCTTGCSKFSCPNVQRLLPFFFANATRHPQRRFFSPFSYVLLSRFLPLLFVRTGHFMIRKRFVEVSLLPEPAVPGP